MTGDEQFQHWLNTNGLTEEWHNTHNACDYAKAAWLASRHETVEEIERIVKNFMCPDAESFDGKQRDCEDSHCKMTWDIIAAIRARYQK